MTHRTPVDNWRATLRFAVDYKDETPIGGPNSPKLQVSLQTLYEPIYRVLARGGAEQVVEQAESLLQAVFRRATFRSWCKGNGQLAPDHLYPASRQIQPDALIIGNSETREAIRVPWLKQNRTVLHEAVAHFCGERASTSNATYRQLVDALIASGIVSPDRLRAKENDDVTIEWRDADAIFFGHNTVAIRSQQRCVVIDPWFFPSARRYPGDYQPLQRRHLGSVDAVAITHSHPDHFDPGSLLQFHRDTLMIVPRVPRETLLSWDPSYRLSELGFRKIVELEWWKSRRVGDITVTALPFYGEQPTVAEQLYPKLRNWGNFYLIQTPRIRCALVADGGQDREGSVKSVALEAYRRWGAPDILFAGCRGWTLYPIQYFESSVRQYLLFVPPELYGVRQSIMNTFEDAIDTAEAWHARYLVPYADGGAPWFSEIGLGPVYPRVKSRPTREWAQFDPYPERGLEALQRRAEPVPGVLVRSPVQGLLLRPGESLTMKRGRAEVQHHDKHRWPATWRRE